MVPCFNSLPTWDGEFVEEETKDEEVGLIDEIYESGWHQYGNIAQYVIKYETSLQMG